MLVVWKQRGESEGLRPFQAARVRHSYLGFHVIEGRRADNGETDQENIGLGVR